MSDFSHLSALLSGFVGRGPAGCACAVAKEGKTLYEGYYGLADIASGRPIAPDTVYRLFSMTKVVVCTAAMLLFERGGFLLQDPLYEYLPEYRHLRKAVTRPNGAVDIVPATQPMLVKHAFMMAVGLPYEDGISYTAREMSRVMESLRARGQYTLREQVRAMAEIPIAFEPGTHWLYGAGHELVAGLIEAVSGMPVGQFLQTQLFDPLGMRDTGYRYRGDAQARMATTYSRAQDGTLTATTPIMEEFLQPDAVYEGGGAGLYATLGDYLRFTQMLAGGGQLDGVRVMGRKTIDLMRQNQLSDAQLLDYRKATYLDGYGYGLGVRTMMDTAQGNSNGSLGEFGWTGLAGTWASIDPSEGASVVYMHQLLPNLEEYHHHRVRAVAYGCL